MSWHRNLSILWTQAPHELMHIVFYTIPDQLVCPPVNSGWDLCTLRTKTKRAQLQRWRQGNSRLLGDQQQHLRYNPDSWVGHLAFENFFVFFFFCLKINYPKYTSNKCWLALVIISVGCACLFVGRGEWGRKSKCQAKLRMAQMRADYPNNLARIVAFWITNPNPFVCLVSWAEFLASIFAPLTL